MNAHKISLGSSDFLDPLLRYIREYILLLSVFLIIGFNFNTCLCQVRPDFVLADSSSDSFLTADDIGNIHASWVDFRQDSFQQHLDTVRYAIFDTIFNVIKLPLAISGENNLGMRTPRIAIYHSYTAIVWGRWLNDGFTSLIYGQLLNPTGQLLSGNFLVNEPMLKRLRRSPDVVCFNDSVFCVVWCGWGNQTPGNWGVYGRIMSTNLAQSGDIFYISADTSGVDNSLSRIATSPSTNSFMVVWLSDLFLIGSRLFYRRYTEDGVPLCEPLPVSEIDTFQEMYSPEIVADNEGNLILVWSARTDSSWGLYVRRFDSNGNPLSESQRIRIIENYQYPEVTIAIDNLNKYVIAWEEEQVNGLVRIMARAYSENHIPLGNATRISSLPDSFSHYWPQIALSHYKIYATWRAYNDIWANVTKFDELLSIGDGVKSNSSTFYLYQNFPNPFNLSTSISFYLPRRGLVEIEVFDILGRRIQTLLNNQEYAGKYKIIWDGKDDKGNEVASGLYLCRMQINDFVQSKKMLLMK
jgi:hypothetical protein